MLPAHFVLCVLGCISFSGGKWAAQSWEMGNIYHADIKYDSPIVFYRLKCCGSQFSTGTNKDICIYILFFLGYF